jgi:hypothetical protein
MTWKELLQDAPSSHSVMPWLGGRRIYRDDRAWRVDGRLPKEFGWYLWNLVGRNAFLLEEAEADLGYGEGARVVKGYLVGDRIIPCRFQLHLKTEDFAYQFDSVALVEDGLDRFTLVEVLRTRYDFLIYKQELFPLGPEDAVRRAFVDKKETVGDIAHVTPALDLAFQFATHHRKLAEEHRAELERKRLAEERIEKARKNMGTGLGRRELAATDFQMAAKAALKVGGAELIDARPGRTRREMVVQYRIENRRLECVAERATLRIVDSGICLTDHNTGEQGDTHLTLESLPNVVRQAMREGRLVVYRHADGDEEHNEYDDGDDW